MNKKRFFSGMVITLIYIAVLVLSLYVHPIFFDAFIMLLSVAGVYEMSRALSHAFSPPIVVIDFISVGLGFAAFLFAQYFFNTFSAGMTAYFISLFVMIFVTILVTAFSKTYVKGNAFSTIFVMLYPCAMLMFMCGLNYFIDLSLPLVSGTTPYRSAGIALLIAVPPLTDTFAYLVGSRLKGKKLCPTISPNKTISGAIGGLFGGIIGAGIVLLVTYLAVTFEVNLFGLGMLTDTWTTTIVNFVMLGLFGSVFDQLGDLVASAIKRKAGIKDYSNLIPGHGGVLDRVDGMVLSGVFFYLYFAVMVLLV